MMLRSSSTPLLGSLLSSLWESPNSIHHPAEFHGSTLKNSLASVHKSHSLLSRGGSQAFGKFLVQSPSIPEIEAASDIYSGSKNGFRRVQSEGNLDGLGIETSHGGEEMSFANQRFKKFGRRPSHHGNLETISSFSLSRMGASYGDEDSDEEDAEFGMVGSGNPFKVQNLVLEETRSGLNGYGMTKTEGGSGGQGKMYLAAGIGVCDTSFLDGNGHGCGGGGGSHRPVAFDRDGGESRGVSMEAHYKRMLEENPGNPLFLRNYAQFLYNSKGDLVGAEEYYARAILADPEDGEVLSQYAKLIWESHHDKERAISYFERSIQVASENSHIQAAYAKFLWDAEDDEDENYHVGKLQLQQGILAPATA